MNIYRKIDFFFQIDSVNYDELNLIVIIIIPPPPSKKRKKQQRKQTDSNSVSLPKT